MKWGKNQLKYFLFHCKTSNKKEKILFDMKSLFTWENASIQFGNKTNYFDFSCFPFYNRK